MPIRPVQLHEDRALWAIFVAWIFCALLVILYVGGAL